jgi:hypothetical protein
MSVDADQRRMLQGGSGINANGKRNGDENFLPPRNDTAQVPRLPGMMSPQLAGGRGPTLRIPSTGFALAAGQSAALKGAAGFGLGGMQALAVPSYLSTTNRAPTSVAGLGLGNPSLKYAQGSSLFGRSGADEPQNGRLELMPGMRAAYERAINSGLDYTQMPQSTIGVNVLETQTLSVRPHNGKGNEATREMQMVFSIHSIEDEQDKIFEKGSGTYPIRWYNIVTVNELNRILFSVQKGVKTENQMLKILSEAIHYGGVVLSENPSVVQTRNGGRVQNAGVITRVNKGRAETYPYVHDELCENGKHLFFVIKRVNLMDGGSNSVEYDSTENPDVQVQKFEKEDAEKFQVVPYFSDSSTLEKSKSTYIYEKKEYPGIVFHVGIVVNARNSGYFTRQNPTRSVESLHTQSVITLQVNSWRDYMY